MEPSPRAPDPAARRGGGRVLVAGRDAGAEVAVGPRLVPTSRSRGQELAARGARRRQAP